MTTPRQLFDLHEQLDTHTWKTAHRDWSDFLVCADCGALKSDGRVHNPDDFWNKPLKFNMSRKELKRNLDEYDVYERCMEIYNNVEFEDEVNRRIAFKQIARTVIIGIYACLIIASIAYVCTKIPALVWGYAGIAVLGILAVVAIGLFVRMIIGDLYNYKP